jgi:hypothetical protein
VVIPRWVGRIIWAFRGKRRVRLHLIDPPRGSAPSVEGILQGRWGGHYVVLMPSLIEEVGANAPLDGHLEVPAERVMFVQVLGVDA